MSATDASGGAGTARLVVIGAAGIYVAAAAAVWSAAGIVGFRGATFWSSPVHLITGGAATVTLGRPPLFWVMFTTVFVVLLAIWTPLVWGLNRIDWLYRGRRAWAQMAPFDTMAHPHRHQAQSERTPLRVVPFRTPNRNDAT